MPRALRLGAAELIVLSVQRPSGVTIVCHLLIHEGHILLHDRVVHVLVIHCLPIAAGFVVLCLHMCGPRSAMTTLLRMSSIVIIATTAGVLRIHWTRCLALGLDPLLRRVCRHECGILNSFKVCHVLGYLLPLLGNITVLLAASGQRLDLHFAVHIGHEGLLRQILVVHVLAAHTGWLLHVAPRPHLLARLVPLRMLLELVHLVNQHHILHIRHLVGLLRFPLLLMEWLLLHRVLRIVDLLL